MESTTSLKAGQVMDRVASLMNDTEKSSYTYTAVLPYLNIAIDEFQEILQVHNLSPTEQKAAYITIPIGTFRITPTESPDLPHYPYDLIEVRGLKERLSGSTDSFIPMNRKDIIDYRTAVDSLIDWMWRDQEIKFVETGANTIREIELDYVRQPIQLAQNENSIIGVIGSRSYLSYAAAALCAFFIGENPTRATELTGLAEAAMNRLLGIEAKGKQAIYTRRRPFRASLKSGY